MYEFHGWFGLADATDAADTGGLQHVLTDLEEHLGRFEPRPEVRWRQGTPFLTVHGSTHRPAPVQVALDELLMLLADRLPGSWGILYEGHDGHEARPADKPLRVRTLTHGRVRESEDSFLTFGLPASP